MGVHVMFTNEKKVLKSKTWFSSIIVRFLLLLLPYSSSVSSSTFLEPFDYTYCLCFWGTFVMRDYRSDIILYSYFSVRSGIWALKIVFFYLYSIDTW